MKEFGFSATFQDCQLNHSFFNHMKLTKVEFIHCHLEGVDFTEADLSNAVLRDCHLLDATFEHTNLQKSGSHRVKALSD